MFSTETVKIAGYFAAVGTLSLAIFCILSIIQLAMVVSKEKVVFAYSKTVITKLIFAFTGTNNKHSYYKYFYVNGYLLRNTFSSSFELIFLSLFYLNYFPNFNTFLDFKTF